MFKRLLLAFIGISVVAILVFGLRNFKRAGAERAASDLEKLHEKPAENPTKEIQQVQATHEVPVRKGPDRAELTRREKDLKALKSKWDEIGNRADTFALSEDERSEVDALVIETLDKLSCSQELDNLLHHLNQEHYGAPVMHFLNSAVEQLLKSARAAEAREEILRLSARNVFDVVASKADWSIFAGAGCDKDSLAGFLDALESSESPDGQGPMIRQNALLGYAAEMAKSNPKEAIILALEQLKLGNKHGAGQALSDRIGNVIPADADFAELQHDLLREASKSLATNDAMIALQRSFIQKWAQAAPADAANYFMEHVEDYPVSFVGDITVTVGGTDPMKAANWAKTFPEGEYRDAAIYGALQNMSIFPDEAKSLVGQIGNAELRRQGEERVRTYFGMQNQKNRAE